MLIHVHQNCHSFFYESKRKNHGSSRDFVFDTNFSCFNEMKNDIKIKITELFIFYFLKKVNFKEQ